MSWADALVLAFRSAGRRLGRTALTLLAVTLGSGLLVALATVAGTADTRVITELGKGGPASAIKVLAAQPDPSQSDSDGAKPAAPHDITDDTVARLRTAPEVTAVTPVLASSVFALPLTVPRATADGAPTPTPLPPTGSPPVTANAEPFGETVVGVDLHAIGTLPVTLLAGRLPGAGSLTEVAVTQGYLDRIHVRTEDAVSVVGTEVELGAPQAQPNSERVHVRALRYRAAIVGVVAQQVADGQFLAAIEQTQRNRAWALSGPRDGDPDFPRPTSPYTGLMVVASRLDSVHTVRAEITVMGYATSAPEHLVASVQKYLHVVDIVLGAIGLVAVVIAALGISNALLAAVRERRREIGVLKAIGARDRDVVRWFLFEALLVGAIGGVLGTVVGLGVAAAVGLSVNGYLTSQGLEGVDLGGVPVGVMLLGVVGTAVLAVLAGALPALRAARLPAREALGS